MIGPTRAGRAERPASQLVERRSVKGCGTSRATSLCRNRCLRRPRRRRRRRRRPPIPQRASSPRPLQLPAGGPSPALTDDTLVAVPPARRADAVRGLLEQLRHASDARGLPRGVGLAPRARAREREFVRRTRRIRSPRDGARIRRAAAAPRLERRRAGHGAQPDTPTPSAPRRLYRGCARARGGAGGRAHRRQPRRAARSAGRAAAHFFHVYLALALNVVFAGRKRWFVFQGNDVMPGSRRPELAEDRRRVARIGLPHGRSAGGVAVARMRVHATPARWWRCRRSPTRSTTSTRRSRSSSRTSAAGARV